MIGMDLLQTIGMVFKMITEKDNQIIIDELRSMSEAKHLPFVSILVCKNDNEFYEAFYDNGEDNWMIQTSGETLDGPELIGWIPMPIYQPTIPPKFHDGSDIQA